MTIYVFTADGKVPAELTQVTPIVIRDHRRAEWRLAPHAKGIQSEARWKRTDFYCTTRVASAGLELTARRLGAELVFLPDHVEQFATQLIDRSWSGLDAWVRVADRTDGETMAALRPAENLEMF